MSQVRTIFKNVSWVMISQVIACAYGFIWTVLLARYLGVRDYGILGFATSLVGIILVTMDLGMNSYAVRHIATDNSSAPKFLGNILPLKLLLSIGTFLLLYCILILMKCDETTFIITLLFFIEGIFISLSNSLIGAFQAFEKVKYQGIESILLNTILLILILISIFLDLGLYGVVMSYILANIIGFIYLSFALAKHITTPKFELDKSFCKNLIYFGLPFAMTGILYSIYYSIDVVMLTQLVGNYATGIYNATYKLIGVLTLFYTVYNAVIYPVMSKFFKNNKKLLVISYEKTIKYLMLIMIPISISTMFYSLDIIQLIYGHEYDAASTVLSILIWTVCLLFVNGAGNTLLTASHKEVTVTKIYSIAAIFNFILNLLLIPYLSYIGAAITTLLSDMLIFIIQKYVIHKIGQKPNTKLYLDLLKIIIGSIVLGIALYLLNLNMWVAIPVGITIYLISLYLLKVFDEDDRYIIKEILGND